MFAFRFPCSVVRFLSVVLNVMNIQKLVLAIFCLVFFFLQLRAAEFFMKGHSSYCNKGQHSRLDVLLPLCVCVSVNMASALHACSC
uniref:Uncharacterized protein n=1 Tax=Rhipicephalus microplus TaxID=6941 RepID=A0A6G5A2P1_RHIMP